MMINLNLPDQNIDFGFKILINLVLLGLDMRHCLNLERHGGHERHAAEDFIFINLLFMSIPLSGRRREVRDKYLDSMVEISMGRGRGFRLWKKSIRCGFKAND